MTWRDIERLIRRDRVQVIAEISMSRNKYWIKKEQVHYEISALQFDKLLEGGFIDPDYRVSHDAGQWIGESFIYEGR